MTDLFGLEQAQKPTNNRKESAAPMEVLQGLRTSRRRYLVRVREGSG